MIYELPKSHFYKCRSLVYEKGQLEIRAVIEGVNPGRIFVDDEISPTTGFVWLGNNDGFFFFGNAENEAFNKGLNPFIDEIIIPEAKKVQLNCFEGMGNHIKWNRTIEKVFKHRKLESWNQRVYEIQKDDYKGNEEPAIAQEYEVVKICKTLFANNGGSIKNIEFLHAKILEFWASPELFFDEGIGYGIVYKNEIVSVCFSGFVFENVHCIDIETLEGFQGGKLAQKLAHSFVKDCLENNMVPYWDCMELNKSSVAVAEKVGFKNIFNYVGYYFYFE